MTGEGLFFTGVVLKNNRDLIQEQATRDQLKIQKEELELRKQEAVERRKKLREDGKVQPKDYNLDNMDPFLAEQFQSQVNDYTSFVQENAFDIKDNNDLTSQQSKLESDLALNGNKYRSISSDLTALNNVATGDDKNSLKLAEDGETYLYQYNYQKIQEEVNSGNMTLDQALEAYPIDPESMVKKSDFVPFYQALIDADDANPQKMYEQDEYNMTGISDDQKTDTTSQIASKLKVNANNNHNDNNAAQVYNNEMVEGPDGSRISGKEAFFLEAYVDPDTDIKGGITSPSQDLMDQLDPKSKNFNRELSDQYAEYLAGKIAERGYRDKKDRRSSKVSGETISDRKKREQEQAQEQNNIKVYDYMQENEAEDNYGVGVQTYSGGGTSQGVSGANINVKVSVKDFHNQMSDEAKMAFKERYLENVGTQMSEEERQNFLNDDSNFTGIDVTLTEVALDGSGNPIGVLEIGDGGPKVIVPWDQLSSAEHDTALKVDGVRQVINYRRPQTQPTQSDDETIDTSQY